MVIFRIIVYKMKAMDLQGHFGSVRLVFMFRNIWIKINDEK